MTKSTRICPVCEGPVVGRSDKVCCSAECKQERKRQYDRERYPEIREQTIQRACEYQRANSEWKQRYDREYRATKRDKEKHAQWSRNYIKANPEYGRLKVARRRARKLENGSYAVSLEDLRKLRTAYGDACAYCHAGFTQVNPLEWDHVVPIARGGSHGIGNLVPSCRKCNRAKAHKFLIEWRAGKFAPRPA